ncbi:MAG: hypothetical protein HRU34_11820 [Richelia sp.]|nr:hypothetical protein [Richelia sp.]
MNENSAKKLKISATVIVKPVLKLLRGKKQVIDHATRDLWDPDKVNFKTAPKRQILDTARELDNLSVLPKHQQELVQVLHCRTLKCKYI